MSLVIDYNTSCSVKFCADSIYSVSGITYRREPRCAQCVHIHIRTLWRTRHCGSTFRRALKHHLDIRCGSGTLHFVPAHLLARNNTHRQTSTHIHTLSSRRRKPVILAFQGPLPRSQSPRPGPASSCSRPSVAGALMQRHAAAPSSPPLSRA